MTYSSLVSSRGDSPKKSSREGAAIDTFLVHHMASTGGPGVTAMMLSSGGRTVSANYTIHSDGTIHGVVPEEYRAWTSGSSTDGGKGAAWDRRSITVEIENETAAPDWRISTAAISAAGRLLADLRTRYAIKNVLGHRDLYANWGASYPTYCPGPDTVSRVLAAEPDNAGGGNLPTPAPVPGTDTSEEDDMTGIVLVRVHDWKGRHYALWPEGIKQITDVDSVKAEEDATGRAEIPVSLWTFRRMLAIRGIESKALNDQGQVWDVDKEKYVYGGAWSVSREARRFGWLAQR